MEGERADKTRPANKRRKRRRENSQSGVGKPPSSLNDAFPGFADPEEQRMRSRHPKRQRQESIDVNLSRPRKQGKRRKRKKPSQDSEQSVQSDDRAASAAVTKSPNQTLHWHTVYPHIPVKTEKQMLKSLLRRKEKERGMIKSAGDRYKEIQAVCQRFGMQLGQALSLRRQHIQAMNPFQTLESLGLGKNEDIRQSAAVFETCVEAFLKKRKIHFWTEAQQKARPKNGKNQPTPDFMLREPTILSYAIPSCGGEKAETRDYVIHWIEVKMFYGASTIANDNKSAVGRILSTATRYTEKYGTGAMVFMQGCGEKLAQGLLELGVVALDAHPVDLQPVERHQRTWCANENGLILP